MEVKFGIQLPLHPMDLIFETAVYAEKNYFDSVWTPDHLVGIGIRRWDCFEAWSVLSALALKTKRVTLGTCVSDPHRKHPAVLAQNLMTLDVLSKGRACLGMGAGEAMNLDPYGINWEKPVSKMREAIEIIKMLLTQDSVNYDGKFFRLEKAFIEPKPIKKPHPPIWIAGNSEKTMKLTAEVGDGWVPTARLPEDYKKNLKKIRKWAKEKGRDPSQIEPGIFLYTVVAEEYEEARKLLELPAKMLMILSPFREERLREFGVNLEKISTPNMFGFVFNRENVEKMIEETQEIPFSAVEKYFVFGSPEECISRFEEYVKAGVRHFFLTLLISREEYRDMLELCAKKVVSYFKY
ncbi:MAG: LLM class flavin-dependent oxidoreductase [Candidatus Hydrothermarchaeota archaeon]